MNIPDDKMEEALTAVEAELVMVGRDADGFGPYFTRTDGELVDQEVMGQLASPDPEEDGREFAYFGPHGQDNQRTELVRLTDGGKEWLAERRRGRA